MRGGRFELPIHKNRSLEMMISLASEFAKTLWGLNCAILHAPKNCSFITTDRPFVIAPPKDRSIIPTWGGVGLLTPGAKKFLPLTADMTIVFGDPGDIFRHIHVNKADVMQHQWIYCKYDPTVFNWKRSSSNQILG